MEKLPMLLQTIKVGVELEVVDLVGRASSVRERRKRPRCKSHLQDKALSHLGARWLTSTRLCMVAMVDMIRTRRVRT